MNVIAWLVAGLDLLTILFIIAVCAIEILKYGIIMPSMNEGGIMVFAALLAANAGVIFSLMR